QKSEVTLFHFARIVRMHAGAGVDPIVVFSDRDATTHIVGAAAVADSEDRSKPRIPRALKHGFAVAVKAWVVKMGVGIDQHKKKHKEKKEPQEAQKAQRRMTSLVPFVLLVVPSSLCVFITLYAYSFPTSVVPIPRPWLGARRNPDPTSRFSPLMVRRRSCFDRIVTFERTINLA